jgi:regulator of PEP synthase PpsR (kinase-PPPase family)
VITVEKVADKASRILGMTITPEMVREIDNARRQLKALESARYHQGETIRCVCGCGQTFQRTHPRAKIHPFCRDRVYTDRGLMALCKLREPEVV